MSIDFLKRRSIKKPKLNFLIIFSNKRNQYRNELTPSREVIITKNETRSSS